MAKRNPSSGQASARQFTKRCARWLVLIALLLLAAFTAYRIAPAPVGATSAASAARVSTQDAAVQSVLAYLRAHSGAEPTPTSAARLDPAQQSVMQYVRAHDRPAPPAKLWDQISQAVLDYLRAHGK